MKLTFYWEKKAIKHVNTHINRIIIGDLKKIQQGNEKGVMIANLIKMVEEDLSE